ncbi:MAG: Ig-like domain-containing protein [Clostridia bacterium]|nr:Ig-like domain-containing protein [Clostridia bacterium]
MKNSKTKKMLSILLAVIMVVGMIPATAIPASAADETTGPIEGATGTGTAEDPYRVYTYDDFCDAVSNAESPDIYVKLYDDLVTGNEFPTNKWMDIGGSLTIDLNSYKFNIYGDMFGNDTTLPYNCEDWSYTICGSGMYYNDHYNIRGDFIVKDSADVSTVAAGVNGKVTMYDGAISTELVLGDGDFIMHNGVCGNIYMSVNMQHKNNIEIYNGRFVCENTYESDKLTGVTQQLFLDDVDYSDVTINTFYAADSNGNVTKIDSMSKFANYGKNRLEFAVATPQFAEQSPKMPEGEDNHFLGFVTAKTYPLYFNAVPLEKEFVDAGYRLEQSFFVYNSSGGLVHSSTVDASTGKGAYFDLRGQAKDNYKINEAINLVDKDGDIVLSKTNTFTIGWTPVKSCEISGAVSGVADNTKTTVELYKSGSSTPVKATTVTGNSEYYLGIVDIANYTVKATAEGYLPYEAELNITAADESYSHNIAMVKNAFDISARISGVPEGRPITINLYKAGSNTVLKTTQAYGQGTFDINNLPLNTAFTLTNIPNGDYVVEAVIDGYEPYKRNITINGKHVVDFFVLESYKTVVVDITGMYETDVATVKLYQKGTDTVVDRAIIKGNGSHIFSGISKGDYTVEVSANGFKTKTSNLYIYSNDSVKGVSFEMELDPSKVDFDFGTQTPSVTDYEKENGITNMGLVFEAPSFSFTADQLNYKYLDMGYSVTTDIDVWYSDSVVGGGDTNHSWTCSVYDYGTKRVVEKVILLDPDGKEIATISHTYTFTYLPLRFSTQKPSVTADEAAAGVTNLGTLTTAPTFSFSAVPIDSSALINEGYSIKAKTEAYQGDILVYSADNGDPYIHAYQYQGKVVQTIELYKNDELLGTKSHTYNFNMEFPEGTLTLGNDFLSIEEGTTQRIAAVVMPEDLANALRWSSSNENIVTVDNNGNVTALQAGSAIITASLPDGTKAYCPVLVTASDVLVYVGGVGLREGEYLAERSSIPTSDSRPADNYAYLSTVDGKLTLTLCNYNYEGTGTFISNRLTYGIYSSADLKIVAEGNSTIGPVTAPLERYTSYGIGEGETISIKSDDYSTLTIKGVNTGIDLARYLFIGGNLNMTDVAGGVSGGNTIGRIALESGKINIDCTGTAFNLIGGELAFDGAKVKINCNSGIRFVRTGNLWINAGRLNIFAENSGIQIKSGDGFQMDNGIVLVDAEYNAIAAEDTLTINGGYMLLRSFNTASDSTYSAINGSGTVTLGTGITGKGALGSEGSSNLTNYSESYKKHFDYLVFSESGINSYLKQPEGGAVEKGETLTVNWELTFTPVRLVLRTNNGSTNTYTELDVKTTSLDLPILPDGGYYLIQAYFATSSYIPSDRFYVTEVTTTIKGNIESYLGDSEFITLTLYDNNMDIPYYQYTLPGSTTSYSFPAVPYGEYVIVAEKPGHDTAAVFLICKGETCYVDISMVLLTDNNYDGELDIYDYQQLINVTLSDEYEDEPDDVYWYSLFYDLDLDGSIDVLDASIMELVINGHRNITDVYNILKGDYDGDGYEYTETDINSMYTALSDIDAYAKQMSTAQKIAADLNYNGAVDEQDLAILKRKFSYLV